MSERRSRERRRKKSGRIFIPTFFSPFLKKEIEALLESSLKFCSFYYRPRNWVFFFCLCVCVPYSYICMEIETTDESIANYCFRVIVVCCSWLSKKNTEGNSVSHEIFIKFVTFINTNEKVIRKLHLQVWLGIDI